MAVGGIGRGGRVVGGEVVAVVVMPVAPRTYTIRMFRDMLRISVGTVTFSVTLSVFSSVSYVVLLLHIPMYKFYRVSASISLIEQIW